MGIESTALRPAGGGSAWENSENKQGGGQQKTNNCGTNPKAEPLIFWGSRFVGLKPALVLAKRQEQR
jgi:hypothetical protein